MSIEVSTSILAANLVALERELRRVENSDYLHIDLMDGHFVPNISLGFKLISDIKSSYPNAKLEVHLMTENPENYIETISRAGGDTLIVHQEACLHLDKVVDEIKGRGMRAGVALIPSTSENTLEYVIDKLDLVLVMTVNPGFCGQKFLESQLVKIERIRTMITQRGLATKLEADGGINFETASKTAKAGIDILVSGSYIFDAENCSERINFLKNLNN